MRTPTGLSPSPALLSSRLRLDTCFLTPPHDGSPCEELSHNPVHATPARYHTRTVWPLPISLATTLGITIVFSSYRY